jgi:O-antigen biosynthesis protein
MSTNYNGERLVNGVSILRPLRFENLERFRFFASIIKMGNVLDLGCGQGEGSNFLSQQQGMHVISCDLSSETLLAAQAIWSSSKVNWTITDGQALCFRSSEFDGIVSVEVIEHIPEPARYLSEVRRVLRPNGIFMLTTPNRLRSSLTPGSLWPEHLREYSPEELESILKCYFSRIDLLGEKIPIYESHPIRKFVHLLAPWIKPYLPRWIRIRALPLLQSIIKPNLEIGDVVFSNENISESPTLVAICYS